VRAKIARHGRLEVCDFRPGWFDETMPAFAEPIAAAHLDVDLASSTRTCLEHLYPLVTGGAVFSQDGHLPLVLDVVTDPSFWRETVGCEPPEVYRIGEGRLIRIGAARVREPAPRG
jgi:O-methyltransferase